MIRFTIFCLCFALGVFHASGQTTPQNKSSAKVIIRVTSTMEDSEVTFNAAWLFTDAKGALHYQLQETPFELSGSADVFVGIFRKKDGKGDLKVQMVQVIDGKEQLMAEAQGPIVIVDKKYSQHSALSF